MKHLRKIFVLAMMVSMAAMATHPSAEPDTLSRIDGDALHDLRAASWRLSIAKSRKQKGRTEVRPCD